MVRFALILVTTRKNYIITCSVGGLLSRMVALLFCFIFSHNPPFSLPVNWSHDLARHMHKCEKSLSMTLLQYTSEKPPHESVSTLEPHLRAYSKFRCCTIPVVTETQLVIVCGSTVQSSDTSCSPISRPLMSGLLLQPPDCELGQYVNKCQVQMWSFEMKKLFLVPVLDILFFPPMESPL